MIAIFLNTKIWGGVDVLTARLAYHLRDRDIPFCIIEPRESRIREELPWAEFIEPKETAVLRNKVTHLIAPSISKLRDEEFPWSNVGNANFLAWVVHPNDAFRGFFPFSGKLLDLFGPRMARPLQSAFYRHSLVTNNLMSALVGSSALVVMDGAATRALRFYYPDISKPCPIVPIPALSTATHRRDGISKNTSIGYFGRVDFFKWSALKPFIKSTLSELSKTQPIEFHAVSEGDYMERLSDTCAANGIEFFSHGFMPNHEAKKLLAEKTDVVLAMGTAALDVAGAGHPCIILDPAVGRFARHQTKFRFVHETDDYTLGEFRDSPGYVMASRSFGDCIQKEQLELAAVLGKKYVAERHDPVNCFDSLLANLYASRITVAEVGEKVRSVSRSFDKIKGSPLTSIFGGMIRTPD